MVFSYAKAYWCTMVCWCTVVSWYYDVLKHHGVLGMPWYVGAVVACLTSCWDLCVGPFHGVLECSMVCCRSHGVLVMPWCVIECSLLQLVAGGSPHLGSHLTPFFSHTEPRYRFSLIVVSLDRSVSVSIVYGTEAVAPPCVWRHNNWHDR